MPCGIHLFTLMMIEQEEQSKLEKIMISCVTDLLDDCLGHVSRLTRLSYKNMETGLQSLLATFFSNVKGDTLERGTTSLPCEEGTYKT